jgi:hypothetical protein
VKRRYRALRNWRIRRWQAYLARHATSREPSADDYYDKMYRFYYEETALARSSLVDLVGEKTATSILLSESTRTRLPVRGAVFLWWLWFLGGNPLLSVGRVIIAITLLVAVAGIGSSRGSRTVKRVFGDRRANFAENTTAVLDSLTGWGRRKALRRILEFPASTLTTGDRALLLSRLPRFSASELETVEKLAEEYDGTIGELLETARLLDH